MWLDREGSLQELATARAPWDIAVVGGGATGIGIALDAASRGYRVILLEQSDFGKGTSSRSTKLIHGGVRYLQQGNISLVMEALKERGLLLRNAPHLVHDLEFVVPNYLWWEAPFYGIGMKVYDLLAGKYGFGPSQLLSRDQVLERIPNLEQDGLRGGVKYHDGQFDDSRLLISLAQTAAEQGACLLNYARVVALLKDSDGLTNGLTARDEESGAEYPVAARCVINATGPFCDGLRCLDEPSSRPIIAPSQGVHVVLSRQFLPGDTAILVPHTRDGRILFALPWHEHVLLGTTDTPIAEAVLESRAQAQEVDFILDTAGRYLAQAPTRAEILSVFVGIRPLVKADEATSTAALSREHTIQISKSGLLTIAGGKWTTYRSMAEDCVEQAAILAHLPERPCQTRELRLHGYQVEPVGMAPLAVYGSEAVAVAALGEEKPELANPLDDALPITGAQVVWGARREMARTVEDVLARRTRALFLNARAAVRMAPAVANLLAAELGRHPDWCREQLDSFRAVAENFMV
jgi:glycerol-3-phosphate dehydrogenase